MGPIAVVLACASVLVLLETGLLFVRLARFERLARLPATEPTPWPKVSVVIAARDEARDIAAAVASRLADDYPTLELILVDDRSTDGTGQLAEQAAAGDGRFSVVRVDELPPGWLGKVHALHRGAQRASGEWLLFSDGDVTVQPGALRHAIACCRAEKLDLLALLPAFRSGSLLVDAIWTVFLRGMLVLIDPRAVRDPQSKIAMGSGAFNLVRRDALERAGGLEPLRLETGDDVGLGLIVKRSGGRIAFVDGAAHATVPMYRSVGAFLRGVEKNGSTTATIPLPLFVAALALLWAVVLAPIGALAVGPAWLRLLGAATLVAYTAGEVTVLWRNMRRWLPALLWPLGGILMSWGLIRATWLAKRNGGVRWRGTFYPLEDLIAGRRVSLR